MRLLSKTPKSFKVTSFPSIITISASSVTLKLIKKYTYIDKIIYLIGMFTNFEIIILTGYKPVFPINFLGVGLSFSFPT